jgi:hypothetical protein
VAENVARKKHDALYATYYLLDARRQKEKQLLETVSPFAAGALTDRLHYNAPANPAAAVGQTVPAAPPGSGTASGAATARAATSQAIAPVLSAPVRPEPTAEGELKRAAEHIPKPQEPVVPGA